MSRLQVVCLHHAGGGSASFHRLRRDLSELGTDAGFTTVTLPGRESRRDEPRYVDAQTCVQNLAEQLDDLLMQPHVLLGHSMGALLAYLLTQRRMSAGLRVPEAVVVASCRAPNMPAPLPDLDRCDDQDLASVLAGYGGLPVEVLDRPDWLALLMPTVRDDLRIVASVEPLDAPPIPCPLHIIGGLDDPLVPATTLTPWSGYSLQPQPVRLYPGDHFLLRLPPPELVADIAHIIDTTAVERRLVS